MNTFIDFIPTLVIAVLLMPMIGACLFCKFEFEFHEDHFLVRRWIFGFCPFGRKRINFVEVEDIHIFGIKKDLWRGAEIFGRLIFRSGVILVKRHGVFRRIYFTPDKPQEFIEKIRCKMVNIG